MLLLLLLLLLQILGGKLINPRGKSTIGAVDSPHRISLLKHPLVNSSAAMLELGIDLVLDEQILPQEDNLDYSVHEVEWQTQQHIQKGKYL